MKRDDSRAGAASWSLGLQQAHLPQTGSWLLTLYLGSGTGGLRCIYRESQGPERSHVLIMGGPWVPMCTLAL